MTLFQQIRQRLAENPEIGTQELAAQCNQTEGAVIMALPPDMVRLLPGESAKDILADLATWGNVTVIVEKAGSFFEIKQQPFPQGKIAYGYYNLNRQHTADGSLSGHLKLENIQTVALVSKPLRGKETHAFVFISRQQQVIFKVYLGRDANGDIDLQQKTKFQQLKVSVK